MNDTDRLPMPLAPAPDQPPHLIRCDLSDTGGALRATVWCQCQTAIAIPMHAGREGYADRSYIGACPWCERVWRVAIQVALAPLQTGEVIT